MKHGPGSRQQPHVPRDAHEERRFLRQARWGLAVAPLGAAGFTRHLWPAAPATAVTTWLGLVALNLLLSLALLTYDLRRFDSTTTRARGIRVAVACGSLSLVWGAIAPMAAFLGDPAQLPWIVNSLMGMVAVQLLVTAASRTLFNVALAGLTGPSAVTLVLIGRADRFAMLLLWAGLMVGLNLSWTAAHRRLKQMTLENAELADALIDERDRLTEAHNHLSYQADHDPLTGLANRRATTLRLEQLLACEARPAVVYLDLDLFKPVNDRFGHETGDLLLSAVADRLGLRLRIGDGAARWGGDEFVLLLAGPIDVADAEAIARRAVAELAAPFQVGDHTLRIGASAGVAVAVAGENVDRVIARADRALAKAKGAGRNHVTVDDPAQDGDVSTVVGRQPSGWTVFDVLGDPVIVLDDTARIRHLNPASERLLGQQSSALRGRSIDDLVHPDDRSVVRFDQGTDRTGIVRLCAASGQWQTWTVRVSDGSDHAAVRGMVIVGHPETDRVTRGAGSAAAGAR